MSGAIGNANGVDLNTASESELENVGGLGKKRAQDIVRNRPFNSIDDLNKIEGFSQKLVDDLKQAGARVGGRAA